MRDHVKQFTVQRADTDECVKQIVTKDINNFRNDGTRSCLAYIRRADHPR